MERAGQTAGLARGPQVRSRRACVRRGIKAGDVDLCALLRGEVDETTEEIALEMRIDDLLGAALDDTIAVVRVLTNALELRADVRLSGLTISRRMKLADELQKEIAP